VQEELAEANDHLEMHHQDKEANKAGSEGVEDPEEIEPASEPNAAPSRVPTSPASSFTSTNHG
jgi:hypothetical protein